MFIEKLKSIFNKSAEENSNKKIENLVFFIIILIVTVVMINYIWNGKSKKANKNSQGKQLASAQNIIENNVAGNTTNDKGLDKKLENILSNIEGVESINVLLSYSESSENLAMYNENSKKSTTEEADKSGGTRKIEQEDSQKEIVYKEENGCKTPIIKKVVEPKIEGAVITVKGDLNSNVKANIIQAVEAVTGLPTHKICVLKM